MCNFFRIMIATICLVHFTSSVLADDKYLLVNNVKVPALSHHEEYKGLQARVSCGNYLNPGQWSAWFPLGTQGHSVSMSNKVLISDVERGEVTPWSMTCTIDLKSQDIFRFSADLSPIVDGEEEGGATIDTDQTQSIIDNNPGKDELNSEIIFTELSVYDTTPYNPGSTNPVLCSAGGYLNIEGQNFYFWYLSGSENCG